MVGMNLQLVEFSEISSSYNAYITSLNVALFFLKWVAKHCVYLVMRL